MKSMEQMSDNTSNFAKVVIGKQNIQTHRSHWKGERHGMYFRLPKELRTTLYESARAQNRMINDFATDVLKRGLQVTTG